MRHIILLTVALIIIFFCCSTITTIRAQQTTFAKTGQTSLDATDIRLDAVTSLDGDTDFAIFGTATSPPKAVKYNIKMNTRESANTLNTGDGPISSATSVGTNVYFAHRNAPARVTRVRASDLARTGVVTLNAGEDDASCIFFNADKSKLIVGTLTSPARVVSVDVSGFSRNSGTTLGTGDDFITACAWGGTSASSHGFFGGGSAASAVIVKVNLNSLTKISTLTLGTSHGRRETNIMSVVVPVSSGGGVALWGAAHHIIKTSLSSNSKISTFALTPSHEFWPRAITADDGTYVYAALSFSPSTIIQVRVIDMKRTAVYDVGADFVRSVARINSSFAVFGSETGVATTFRLGEPPAVFNLTSLECYDDMHDLALAMGLLALFAWWILIIFVGAYAWKWCHSRYACCRNKCECCHPGHSCDPAACPDKCKLLCDDCKEQCCKPTPPPDIHQVDDNFGSNNNKATTSSSSHVSPTTTSPAVTVRKLTAIEGDGSNAATLNYSGGSQHPLSPTMNQDDAVMEEDIE